MKLIKVSALNLIASLVRIATQLAVTKIIVLSAGASGLVTFGQIQNLISLLGTGSTLGSFGGVVKQTADGKNDPELVWGTALYISWILAAVSLAGAILLSEELARFLFNDISMAYLVVVCAAANFLVVLQALVFHAVAGLQRFKLHVVCSVINSIVNLVLVATAALVGGSILILLVMCLSQAIQIVGAGIAFARTPEMRVRGLLRGIDKRVLIGLVPFVAIGLTTAGVFPITQLFVRSHLIATFGLAQTAPWEAAMKISALYISLLSTALGLYLLPAFSKIGPGPELRRQVFHSLGIVLCVLLVGAALQFLVRDWIIVIVFSQDLLAAADLLVLQLPGDVARGLVTVLVFLATSQARSWTVVAINATFGAVFYAATLFWAVMPMGTIENASTSYTIGSFAALFIALAATARLIFGRNN
jgi:PST family polysaccharide transporter